MPLEEVIAGVTFTGFATTPPTIPGLVALGIFGSGMDGNNGNRVAGSPAMTNTGGGTGPTINTNSITVNNGTTQTPAQGFDTNIVETITPGWTVFCVGRFTPISGSSALMGIGPTGSFQLVLNPANTLVSSHASFYINGVGLTISADLTYDLGAGVSIANWRMYAASFPGTQTAQAYTLLDVTGNASRVTTTTQTRGGAFTGHFTFGHSGGTGQSTFAKGDVAAGGFCSGVLSLAQLRTVRTWLLGVLAVRGVTGF